MDSKWQNGIGCNKMTELSHKEILLLREAYVYRKINIESTETDKINTAMDLVGKKLLTVGKIIVMKASNGTITYFLLTKKGKDLVEKVLSGYKTETIPEFIQI